VKRKSSNYVPDRGDLVWITLNPTAGHEQAGRCPAMVISPRSYNRKTGLCIVCPATRQAKGYAFEVEIVMSVFRGDVPWPAGVPLADPKIPSLPRSGPPKIASTSGTEKSDYEADSASDRAVEV
jgi:hypothetical protein